MSTKNILTTFKITSVKSGEKRRFPATNSLAELKKNISCFWEEHPFVLTYLDEDGDVISVSTEFEFSEAITVANEMKLKVLKLNAYLSYDEFKTHSSNSKKTTMLSDMNHNAIHHGVVCDRSGMNPIIGIRYHIPGADYDLCSNEYEKLSQDERSPYVKIESPGSQPIPCNSNFKLKNNGHCPRIIYGCKSPYFHGGQQQRRSDGGCPFRRQSFHQERVNQPPDMSVDELMFQASLAASMLSENLNSHNSNDTQEKSDSLSSPFAHVLGSFIDAAGVAAMKAATKHSEMKKEKNNNKQACSNNEDNKSFCNQEHESNPLTELLYGIRRNEFLQQKTNPSGGGGGKNDETEKSQKKELQENLRSQIRSKVKEHFQNFNQQQNENSSLQQNHPMDILLSSLMNQTDNNNNHNQNLKNEKGESIHYGVECDRSGMNPIIGIRYTIPNANYDLSQNEYDKLSENERLMFFKILSPGTTPISCNDQSQNEMDSNDPSWTKIESKNINSLSAEEPDDKEKEIIQNKEYEVKEINNKIQNENENEIHDKKTDKTMKPKILNVTTKSNSKEIDSPPVITLNNIKNNTTNEKQDENLDNEYTEQLIALANIGFIDRDTNLTLLKRYQGRVDRVINYILENGTQIH